MINQSTFPPSLWGAITPTRAINPPLHGIAETDVAVIGAGFTGLSAALEIARQGQSVTVLEGHTIGWGASGRNNGQVIPILTSAEPDEWLKRYGESGKRMVQLIGNSANVLFDLVREYSIEAEAEQTGWFQPAHSPGRVKLLQRRVDMWRQHGFAPELRDSAQTRDLLGSEFWYGGMFNASGGHINPLALARGMAQVAENLGARIHETTPVLSYERKGAQWVVTTQDGASLKARALILATNAYTGELEAKLAPKVARSIVPVLSWQMATEPVRQNLRSTLLPGRQAVSDTRGDLRFFRYDARNRLITGGAVMSPFNAAKRVQHKAVQNLNEAFPELGIPKITHIWSGYIGMNWDRFPRIHKLGTNGWAWIGCNGRGVALATALGRELGRVTSGVDLHELALPITDPQPFPMHSFVRRLAPSYLAWLKRQDLKEPKD